ncbi:SIMPL domain-containing protein [Terriglobus albidus]|uniref:SIMPL domain-containing protein n=1 Tax=Terriglobus albidus TaxID=1592106 RepID=UPI0021E0A8FC|nr:SIMPL domain-containing protein [Terriglobus albidus]
MKSPLFAVVLLSAATLTALAQTPTLQINKENRTISVSATDSVTTDADLAIIHVGFQVLGRDEQGTYAEGSRVSNAIMGALTAAGVEKASIESENQNLSPLNDFEIKQLPPDRAANRFRLVQSWSVKTSPETAAKVLDTAVKAGANQSGAIDWQLKDELALEAQAAAKALAHAQRIAEQMAAGLHSKLGPLVYASNEAPQAPRPVPMMRMAMAAADKATIQPLAINSRKVERAATVTAIFAVE